MVKFIQTALLLVTVGICCSEPARLRKQQSKILARQEAVEEIPAQTPYPPAGIVPQVRFDLPTEDVVVEPDNTYLPPDSAAEGIPAKTYGPPEAADPKSAVDDDVVTEKSETEQPIDLDQSETTENPLTDEAEDNEIDEDPSEEELLLVLPLSPSTKTARLQARPLRTQRLISQPIPYRSQRLIGQQLYFADGRFFAYTPQYVRV